LSSSPLISVLLPLYNGARTVLPALRSLQRQSHRHIEIVVVDDGSTDSGPDLVERSAQSDPRIRLIPRPHRGLIATLNHGLECCRGETIARMDADDISCRKRLAIQLEYLEAHPEIAVVGSTICMAPRGQLTAGMLRYEAWSNSLVTSAAIHRDLFVESPICHPSVLFRAACIRHLGGYRDLGWPEDHDLWLRFDAAGLRLAKIDRPLLIWRESTDRLSRRDARYSRSRFFALKLHHVLERAAGRNLLVWGAGQEGKIWIRELAATGLLAGKAVDVDPRKVGQRIHGCEVIRPERLGPPSPAVLLLVAVGATGARESIRSFLNAAGYHEQEHYLCVA
jgi:glycosyltransferase involved in cell wall biosynthesis